MNFLKQLFYTTEEVEVTYTEEKNIQMQEMFDIEVANNHNYFADNILVSNCRNPKIQRSKLITEIISVLQPLKIWLLTGTPIDNRPIDYYNLLKLIKHPISKNWIKYVERYCDGGLDEWGRWKTKGASNLEELHRLTQDTFLRRLKTNAGIDLPNKYRKAVFLELKDRKGYDAVIEDYRKNKFDLLIDEEGFDGVLQDIQVEKMTELLLHRQFCALEKIKDGSLIDLIDNVLEESDDNKILVFTNFRAVIDAVMEHFGSKICNYIDGRILDPRKRLEIMDDFNNNPDHRVQVNNIKAGGTGLNGQGGNYVIVNDMDWVPSNMLQAEDRCWRIGQKRDVNVLYPIYDNTVENILYDTVEKKRQIISTVIEGTKEQYFEGKVVEDKKEQQKEDKKSLLEAILAQFMGM